MQYQYWSLLPPLSAYGCACMCVCVCVCQMLGNTERERERDGERDGKKGEERETRSTLNSLMKNHGCFIGDIHHGNKQLLAFSNTDLYMCMHACLRLCMCVRVCVCACVCVCLHSRVQTG